MKLFTLCARFSPSPDALLPLRSHHHNWIRLFCSYSVRPDNGLSRFRSFFSTVAVASRSHRFSAIIVVRTWFHFDAFEWREQWVSMSTKQTMAPPHSPHLWPAFIYLYRAEVNWIVIKMGSIEIERERTTRWKNSQTIRRQQPERMSQIKFSIEAFGFSPPANA